MGRNNSSKPPPDVKGIIDVVRMVPSDADLKHLESVWSDIYEKDTQGLISRLEDRFDSFRGLGQWDNERLETYEQERIFADLPYEAEALTICVDGLPRVFLNYIGFNCEFNEKAHSLVTSRRDETPASLLRMDSRKDAIDGKSRFEELRNEIRLATARYEEAREWFLAVYALAHLIQFRAANSKDFRREYMLGLNLDRVVELDLVEGKIVFRDKLVSAFNNVDAYRIKICGSCKKVFWATRLDMKGCSTPCSKVLRTRKWREMTTEKQRVNYKINRIRKAKKKGD